MSLSWDAMALFEGEANRVSLEVEIARQIDTVKALEQAHNRAHTDANLSVGEKGHAVFEARRVNTLHALLHAESVLRDMESLQRGVRPISIKRRVFNSAAISLESFINETRGHHLTESQAHDLGKRMSTLNRAYDEYREALDMVRIENAEIPYTEVHHA